jgi:hypothetical protein
MTIVDVSGVTVLIILLWVVVGGGVGAAIGSSRGRTVLGFVLGLVLGVIGWVIIALLPPLPGHPGQFMPGTTTMLGTSAAMYRECPQCKEQMRRDASLCPHCRSASEPWTYHEGRWWVTRPSGSYYLDAHSQQWARFEPHPTAPSPPAEPSPPS